MGPDQPMGSATARRRPWRALGMAGVMVAATAAAAGVAADGVETDPTAIAAIDPTLLDDSRPSISDDGRILVTQTVAEGRATIMLTDLASGQETELSAPAASARPGHSVMPQLSADGCTVTAMTELALDPFRDDDGGDRWDLYQLLLPGCGGQFGAWELVSSTPDGSARDDLDPAEAFTVSATGSQVAFVHPTDDGISSISIADLTQPISESGRIIAVAPIEAGPPSDTVSRHRGLAEPSLSADGDVLAFTAELIPDPDTGPDTGPVWRWAEADEPGGHAPRQVLVWHRPADDADDADDAAEADDVEAADTGRFEIVSARPDGRPGSGAMTPLVSGDGEVVVFASADTELVPAEYRPCRDEVCARQIFVAGVGRADAADAVVDPATDTADPDEQVVGVRAGEIRLVSAIDDPDGGLIAGDRSSWLGHVNVDGSQVVFITRAGNLSEIGVSAGGEATDGDLYLAEISVGRLTRVTDLVAAGVPAAHSNPRFSASGRRLVFDTLVGDRLDGSRVGDTAAPDADADADAEAGAGSGTEPAIGVTTLAPALDGEPARSVVSITTTPEVSMPDIDFGSVIVGLPSDERFVRVRNDGPGVLRPATITTTDARFTVTDNGTCRRGVVVAAGSACTVTVVFRPDDAAPAAAELMVAEDGDPAEAVVVRATLSGAGGEPVIRVEPAGVDLAAVVIGAVDDDGELLPAVFDVIGFTNIGDVAMSVAEVSVSSSEFTVFSEDCTSAPIGPAGRCEVAVAARPTSAGNHSALVRLTTSDGQYASAVVSVSADYDPVLETFADAVPAGAPIGVSLTGFPADAELVVGLSDRPDSWTAVRTDADGRAMALIEPRRLERSGERTLVAIGPANLRASTLIEIQRGQAAAVGLPGFGYGFSGR